MNIRKVFFLCVFFAGSICYAETEGENLFKQNRPEEAVVVLEQEIAGGTASSVAYNYLGLGYYQLGEYQKSIDAFNKGLSVPGTNKKVLAYNQGNSYYAKRDFYNAAKSFSLALTADSEYYDALLNRANSYLMGNMLGDALTDYKKYIIVVPNDPQRESIIKLISLLEGEIENRKHEAEVAEKEAEKLAEEEKRMQQEMEKQAEEERVKYEAEQAERKRIEDEQKRIDDERKAAEAERRRKLLEDVANSLQNTDSTNMSAGAEDLIDYEMEAELD